MNRVEQMKNFSEKVLENITFMTIIENYRMDTKKIIIGLLR